ncbi:MAG: chlorophyll a/b binding light-harvesting protein [Elainellaceae cyanobacterium]
MDASNNTQVQYPWWAGNARFINLSNTFVVAHVAQAALIMFWAGAFTLFELFVYSPDEPLYTQGLILLPHLASEGWGIGSGGAIVDTYTWFAIGVIHIVAAGVLAGGAYFHRTQLTASLAMASGKATKFHFDWQDAGKLGLILGHHLIILGLGALLFVAKAQFFGGLYDANLGEVRLVTSPTLDPATLWDYRTHLFDVNNLEDLVGGHIYVAVLLIAGGAWHILVSPFGWVKRVFLFSGDGILSYSLFGIAIAGFAASYYCGFNSLAYPEEFYGPTLELKSAFLPRYFEAQPTLEDGYTVRTWLANAHFYLAFFFLQGGLWHFQRAMGLDISNMVESWKRNWIAANDNPTLIYQQSNLLQPRFSAALQYEMPQMEAESWLRQKQPFEDYFYRQSQGIEQPSLTTLNGVEQTLYQTTYHPQKDTFYQAPRQAAVETLFGYGDSYTRWLYELPRTLANESDYDQPIATVFYEPQQQNASENDVAIANSAPKPAKKVTKPEQ